MNILKYTFSFVGNLETIVYNRYKIIRHLEEFVNVDFLFPIKDAMVYEAPKSLR